MAKGERRDGTIKDLKPILKYYKDCKWSVSFAIVFFLVIAVMRLLEAICAGNLLASFENFDWHISLKWAILLAVTDITHSLSGFISSHLMSRSIKTVNQKLTFSLVDRINSLKQSNFDRTSSLMFFTRIDSDVEKVTGNLYQIAYTFASILGGITFVSYTAYLNIWIGLYLVFYFVVYTASLSWRSRVNKIDNESVKRFKDENGTIVLENIRGIKDVRSYDCQENITNRVKDYEKKQTEGVFRSDVHSNNITLVSNILVDLLNLTFAALSIWLIVRGDLMLAGFMIAYNFKTHIWGWAGDAGDLKTAFDQAVLASHRINELFDENKYPIESFGDEELQNVEGRIEFKNVSFEYVDGQRVLNGLSLDIEPCSIVSLVGESGGGKSTIISLINKLYTLKEGDGEILLDGKNINNLTRKSLRESVCVVSQQPYIFDMSVAENLRLAKQDATDEELVDVLKKAELYSFVKSQKNQLDTRLGENGIKLSGGQRQRLALARSLLKKAKVIIYDEATSSLDNENQSKIKDIMKKLSKNHTIIMVAHRLSTVVDSDNIFFIKDGKVLTQGTHEQLMKNCEEYRTLYASEEKSAQSEQ